ncbi:Gamma-tubulin complex component 2 [Camellia lanceoleosa]|uniref:Gamma-tubulin complex component 2 n=1 Tax=Camellia lanceoleosa TaxID=1840588 RepID=A0ACC0F9H5_9ERIC|nr:Gamma-tubulin complex component 2 [Camellia lanceoleosa]
MEKAIAYYLASIQELIVIDDLPSALVGIEGRYTLIKRVRGKDANFAFQLDASMDLALQLVGGNSALALAMTVISNLLGILIINSPRPVDNSVFLVKDVVNPSLKKDHQKIRSLVFQEEHDALALIPILVEKEDVLVWHHNSVGSYTIKSGYQCALRLTTDPPANLPSSSTPWCDKDWNFMWSLNLPPKLKHFVWRLCNNILATKQNLHHRRCSISDMYRVCSQSSKSIEHVFLGCAWTKAVWFGSGLGILVEFHAVLFFQKMAW